MKHIALFVLLLAVGSLLHADIKQVAPAKTTAQEEADKEPPPKTLEEAHLQLEKLLPKDELASIDSMKSEDGMGQYHHGLGMGLRNSWGLWGGSPLARHMNKLGFHHPDDMSAVILETFWCKRHKKDFRLEERAVFYDAYWKSVQDPPDSATDPKDGSTVEWKFSIGAGDDKTPRQIHVGRSKKSGRWLAYEYDKGVYEADEAIIERIPDTEKNR